MISDQQHQIDHCVFRESHDAFFVVHPADLRMVEVNPSAQRLTGFRRQELLALTLAELFERDDGRDVDRLVQACQTTSLMAADDRFVLKTKAGGRLPVRVSVSKIHTEPEPLGLLIVADITRQRLAEAELRASRECFRRLAEEVRAIPWVCDADSQQFDYVGPQAVAILGYSLDDWRRPGFWSAHLHPEDREPACQARRAVSEDNDGHVEYRMLRADGQAVWLHDIVGVRPEADGSRRLHGILVDISQRKEAEAKQHELATRMWAAQKLESLGVLAGGIAHDFSNLLTAIMGHTNLAQTVLPPESPAQRHLNQVVAASQTAADLTNEMLAYSGKGKLHLQPLTVPDLVQTTTDLIRITMPKRHRLRFQFERDVPLIAGDAAQFRQIVMNLILNASHAIGDREGTISLGVRVRPHHAPAEPHTFAIQDLPSGPTVCLEVTDTGCGMNAETQAKVFDPFFTTKSTGRGLGLAAVLGIVRRHRGAIRILSAPGQGTTFRVYFPARRG